MILLVHSLGFRIAWHHLPAAIARVSPAVFPLSSATFRGHQSSLYNACMSEESEQLNIPMRVLIVDNEKDLALAMKESLERIGMTCTAATSGPDGAKLLRENNYEIVVTDLMMNDVNGMEILKQAKELQPDCEVILVSGHATVPLAVEAMREQAFNFLEKPITPKRLQAVVSKAADAIQLRQQNLNLRQRLDERFGFENLIFASDNMQAVIDRLRRIAPTDAGVLITGETGTGKDVVAQAIHQNSPRKKRPFVAINTAAVAEHLVESELFGHIKGAFTDAISDRQGKFEYANGGTLFLDEVGDMPMATQIKLLRVLEEREITRVGDNKPIPVNVRVLAATNKDLEREVEAGRFRSDLYFRLKIVTVHLDPLNQRREDILPLADHFRKQANKKHSRKVKGFSPELRRWLLDFHWKGNVRQLKNVIESLVVMDIDDVLDADDLSPDLIAIQPIAVPQKTSELLSARKLGDQTDSLKMPGSRLNEQSTMPSDKSSLDDVRSPLIGKSLQDIERWAIEHTLTLANHNREETARILGISERNLYRKLKEYDLR
jgi:two-component system, NtrC family, response regulator HydG